MAYLFPLIQLIAAAIGTWKFGKLTYPWEKMLVFFLWYTVFIEFGKLFLTDVFKIDVSWWWHESYNVISYLFYLYWYYCELERKWFKRVCILFTLIFVIMKVFAYIYPEQFVGSGYTFVTSAVGLLVLTLFHFFQLLRSDEVLVVKYKLSFWVSTALLLFYMGIIPLVLLSKYIDLEDTSDTIILISLNCILYGCYSIGFLWMRKSYIHS